MCRTLMLMAIMTITVLPDAALRAQAVKVIDSTFSRVGRILPWHGGILVTDQAGRSLRSYSSSGVLVRSTQFPAGDQPGSFIGGPMWLAANDSMVFCTDITSPRILVFDTLFNFRAMLGASSAGVTGVGVTADGSLLVSQFLGTESVIEVVTPTGELIEKIPVASSASDPYSTYCTLIPLPRGLHLLLFHYSNSVWLMQAKSIVRKITIDSLTQASQGNTDIRKLKSNSLQTAFSDGAKGFWIVEGELGSVPRRSMRHLNADGREIGRSVFPERIYFAVTDVKGEFLYVVPEDRQRVVRYRLSLLLKER